MSTKWTPKTKTPFRQGWYITRTEAGDIQWRAWGCGAWWKQIKGGWIEWFTGDGESMRYDFQPASRKSIDLDANQLPELP